MPGNLERYADKNTSRCFALEKGVQKAYIVNYKDLAKGKNLAKNNIELRVGDTIIVPEK